ncbi:hypothetical protein ABMA27_009987 [Loxostege sticticalis]|uniref:Reverse transcriptase domain-containing protein n=1 Tax=Loxostege sticticalis TaxID=481309 RepID=A0ABR3H771_LOXSC
MKPLMGAARILFSSDTAAPNSLDTLTALQSKHPSAPSTPLLPDPPSATLPCLQATEDAVMAAIMSFNNGSAGGLDGITPQHLKDLVVSAPSGLHASLLTSITRLVNLMLGGKVNSEVTSTLYGANLCALTKKDGSVRPIAIGSTFRRLASKICCRHILPSLESKFQPIQLGFGSKGGCEAAVHACRTYLQNSNNKIIIKLDVKNAFNSVDRNTMLSEVKKVAPNIYPYIWQCYSCPSNLLYQSHTILSSVGCQQGDPLGPAIFSLAIHPIISELTSKFNVWYLDDGTLGGDVNSILDDLDTIKSKFDAIGLKLNYNKCELYIDIDTDKKSEIIEKFEKVCPGIKILSKETLFLLGAPIFSEGIPDFIHQNVLNFNDYADRLLQIHSHMAIFILRSCLFVPKFTYTLRCSPFWKHQNFCESLDQVILNQIQKIINIKLDNRMFLHATLPIRHGGLGIRQISSVALPAFLSSVHSTLSLVGKILNPSFNDFEVTYLSEAINAWRMACPGEDPPSSKNCQKLWDEPICRSVYDYLLNSSPTAMEKARMLAAAQHESGYWLQAYPSQNLGNLLDNNTFRLAVGLRLGANLVEPHHCHCGVYVDRLGHHGLACLKSAGRLPRHACLNDIIRRALVSVNVPATLEPTGLTRDDGKRPDGMTLVPWQLGRPLVWDATCVDTLAPSHLGTTSLRAGAAATAAEAAKRRKYANIANSCVFAAFAVETLGPWGPEARKFFINMKNKLIRVTGDHRAGSFLGQRIGIAIQRGNAASIMGTLPGGSGLGDLHL